MAVLMSRNARCAADPMSFSNLGQGELVLVRRNRGAARLAKLGMYWRKKLARPKKDLSCFVVRGKTHSVMAFNLHWPGRTPREEMVWPRY